jgi:hypothetical protein
MNQAQEAKKPMIAQACDSVLMDCAPQAMKKTQRASEMIEEARMMKYFMTGKVYIGKRRNARSFFYFFLRNRGARFA